MLNGAFVKGVRWRWVGTNPVEHASPPAARKPDPQPPSAEEAARIVAAASRDPDWGALVWLTMTTGARRGELCALRWSHVDLNAGVVTLRRALDAFGEEKDTKTHQQRQLALDADTIAVLTEHWERCCARAAALGLTMSRDAYVFSLAPDGSTRLVPGSVTQRYSRLVRRLGIDTHLHNLRHYSATELIAAGVDVRTVAGRLGHSGGGITTLRVYAAWLSESDQRAADGLLARMPGRPAACLDPAERAQIDPQNPREVLACRLRAQILDGTFAVGDHMPSIADMSARHGVAGSTVSRAIALLKEWGLVDGVPRGRVRVVDIPPVEAPTVRDEQLVEPAPSRRRLLNLEVRHRGTVVAKLTAEADPTSAADLRELLLGAICRAGGEESAVADYELDVRIGEEVLFTFVTTPSRTLIQ
ncbi:MAG: tyrosine-type recombinase/integrase [Pseudonocardia sp.]